MAREFSRLRRIEEMISRKLAEIIHRGMDDPRVGMIAITAVTVSKDLLYAKIFFTTPGSKEEIIESTQALNKAKGYLRTVLSQSCQLRSTPSLQFVYDLSEERGLRVHGLIDEALKNVLESSVQSLV